MTAKGRPEQAFAPKRAARRESFYDGTRQMPAYHW